MDINLETQPQINPNIPSISVGCVKYILPLFLFFWPQGFKHTDVLTSSCMSRGSLL